VVNVTPRSLYPRGKIPVPIVQEAGWTPGPVWTVAENIAPLGFKNPNLQAHSKSLYRLRYLAQHFVFRVILKINRYHFHIEH